MPQKLSKSLRNSLGSVSDSHDCYIWAVDNHVALSDLVIGSSLGGRLPELSGRSVLVATHDQLTTALALIELDGVAQRLVLCPPDLSLEHRSYVIEHAGVDSVVSDRDAPSIGGPGLLHVTCHPTMISSHLPESTGRRTEWIMLTSGTSGVPKMVVHSLASLTGAITNRSGRKTSVVWGTFYDIRRYGGLQIFLRTMLCRASIILSSAQEPIDDHLRRLGAHGVTHLSGTPSHWRRAIISPEAHAISPEYVRLSGEITDQPILDSLHSTYPQAAIAHAYASTEAGVGFEVNDRCEGFPSHMIGLPGADVEMKVVDGSLRVRSPRTAVRYLGGDNVALLDAEGFVDTGDIVEQRGERHYFVGRRGGIINVGGLKVHPEEVEAVINRHPDVRMSLVRSRKNPITGAIVVADVVLFSDLESDHKVDRTATLQREILQVCRTALPLHKIPAAIRFVPSLDVAATGKLVRSNA